jgi:hypothetical protein
VAGGGEGAARRVQPVTAIGGLKDAEGFQRRGQEVDKTLARLRAERDQLDSAIQSWEQRRAEVELAAAKAGVRELAEQGVRRSLLTPKQKSEIRLC